MFVATQESTSQQSTLLRYHDAIVSFLTIAEMNAAVNQACVNCACTVNCALPKDKEYARCATLTDKQDMHKTEKEERTREVLFRTGNRITPPTARVKQSEWSRLQTATSDKFTFHQTVYKIQIRLISHCNRTSRAIEFHCLDTKVETQSR